MLNHKIVIYIPTLKRSYAIQRVLSEELGFLSELNIDICIYDSSPDNETCNIVKQYKSQYSNLKYERVSERIPSNKKYFDICEKEARGKYEYVWIIQDHMVFTRLAALHILDSLDKQADFYYLDMMGEKCAFTDETDLNEFAVKSAWMLTRFGTAILRTDSFLNGVDWNNKKKWLNKKTINNSHVGLYFERLAEMDNPRVETISFARDQFYDFMRFQPVAWSNELLRICLECWGTTIYRLPSFYRKEAIVRSQDSLFISTTQLLSLKAQRRYGLLAYWRFKKWIELVYPNRKDEFKGVATLTLKRAEHKYIGNVIQMIDEAAERGLKIYIFGAGRHASEFSRYISEKNIEFDGFLVSKSEGNPERIGEHLVLEAHEALEKEDALIIIAVAAQNVESIKSSLAKINHKVIITSLLE